MKRIQGGARPQKDFTMTWQSFDQLLVDLQNGRHAQSQADVASAIEQIAKELAQIRTKVMEQEDLIKKLQNDIP